MGLSFFVGEIEAQTNEAIQIANEHRQNAGILKDAINAYLRAPLSGKTYDSARNYFGAVYPPIASGMILVAESMIEAHTKFPAKFQEIVGGGDIEEDRLREQIQEGQNILRAYADVLNKEEKQNIRMERAYMRMQEGIAVLEERLQKLYEFNSVSADIFNEALTNIENLNRGVDALEKGGAWHAASGTFDITKLDMTWVKPIQEKWQEREQNYEKKAQLEVRIGKNALGGTTYEVYNNGIYDEKLTKIYNDSAKKQALNLLREKIDNDKLYQFFLLIGKTFTMGGKAFTIKDVIGMLGNQLFVLFDGNNFGSISLSNGLSLESIEAVTSIATGIGLGTIIAINQDTGLLEIEISYISVNQINEQIKLGKSPNGIKRVDKGFSDVEDAQDHIHFDDSRWTLNKDGSWGHNSSGQPPQITKKILKWLQKIGWGIPK
ncbi:T7SS effector LXG polymorphic toxin [Enterococcus sp. LJL51]|uniref:T7SS effector LXG polymorphic toxin n=1 Tax=Enterococcus sp. LJL51 TaxID=3416656 RepID=UPI003CF2BFD4